ncbi:uncharacterized protein LOC126742097 [Anthonomus grandis grandis]|uniref:uncharacterized protein LOC126742097 n=1 Tax=Anthonomus grandis grandis TaxID=2921223 RepID=UPI0021660B52|nr:uncharacterized protein LOC126742097 [Anthonomus grandis grandis]
MCKFLLAFGALVVLASGATSDPEADLTEYVRQLEDTPKISIVDDLITLEKSPIKNFGFEARGSEDIVERYARFLGERQLTIRLPEAARGLLSDARSKKIRRVLLPLLLLLKLKAAIVLPIILSIIALVSFKGFGMSLAALAIAGTTALKNILEHSGSNKLSYEVVSAPVAHLSRSGVDEIPIYQ